MRIAHCNITAGVENKPVSGVLGCTAGRFHAMAAVRQGSTSKPAFHDNGVLGTLRMRSVLTEAWSRGCSRYHGGLYPIVKTGFLQLKSHAKA